MVQQNNEEQQTQERDHQECKLTLDVLQASVDDAPQLQDTQETHDPHRLSQPQSTADPSIGEAIRAQHGQPLRDDHCTIQDKPGGQVVDSDLPVVQNQLAIVVVAGEEAEDHIQCPEEQSCPVHKVLKEDPLKLKSLQRNGANVVQDEKKPGHIPRQANGCGWWDRSAMLQDRKTVHLREQFHGFGASHQEVLLLFLFQTLRGHDVALGRPIVFHSKGAHRPGVSLRIDLVLQRTGFAFGCLCIHL
mmetsp:Transcript_50421/g.109901  ORF Transcript_50421/g.109901 Transcript_50421/m.109901 type:complete len:246 (+) Transcript_50421:1187-1924(+)